MCDVMYVGEWREYFGCDYKEVYFGVVCGMDVVD